jgi:RHS repeat-associated protein
VFVRSRTVAPLLVPLLCVAVTSAEGLAQASPQGLLMPCQEGNYAVSVGPNGGAVSWPQNTNGHTSTFTVRNGSPDNCANNYTFSYTATGPISGVTLDKMGAGLGPGASTTVTATYNVGAAGSGVLTLQAVGEYVPVVSDNGYYNVTVLPPPPPTQPSNWDVAPFNHDHQAVGRCAAGCFAAMYAHSTVPYISLDVPRNVTLVYHGDRVWPKPFIHLNVQKPSSSTPDTIFLQVRKGGAWQTFVNGDSLLKFTAAASGWQRIGGQLRDSTWATNMYDVDLVVTWHYPGGSTSVQTWTTKVLVANETTTPIARGWTLAGVQRAYPQPDSSVLITEGDGSAVFFWKSGSTWFWSPNGEFSTLVVNGTGWKRVYPDSTKVYFNSAGRMTDVYDRFNNRTQFFYDGSNRPTTIRDPNLKDLVLAYGTYGLSSIRDNIAPFRYTNLTVPSDSTLTAIQDPDGVSTTLQYDGSRRLWKVTDRGGNTTTLAYQTINGKATGKLVTVTAPAVPIYTGGTAAPVVTYSPWQTIGVPYTSTVSTPYPVVTPDTVYGREISPTGDTMRFTVDRWGQPIQTTDPLGRTTSVLYTGAGLPSRVTYPTGAYDTLAYNSSGLVTYSAQAGTTPTNIRYTAWALADSVWGTDQRAVRMFVSGGKVDSVRVARTYISKYQYDSRGRVTHVTDPAGHLLAKTTYGATNDNRLRDSLPGGRMTTYGYDTYGRQTSIAQSGVPTRSVVYDVLNRPTETYDGVNPSPTRYAYDSLYLRSVTDLKNQVYQFAYNAVGQLLTRTDPLGHSDRYAYDRAGDLRRWWNRRGDSTDYVYDRVGRLVKKFGPRTSSDSFHYAANDREVTALSYALSPTWRQTTYLDAAGRTDSVTTVVNGYNYTRRYRHFPNGLVDSAWSSVPPGTALLTRRHVYNTTRGTLDSVQFGPAWTVLGMNGDLLPSQIFLPGADTIVRDYSSIHGVTEIRSSAIHRKMSYDTPGRVIMDIQGASETSARGYTYDQLGRVATERLLWRPQGGENCWYQWHYGWMCQEAQWYTDSTYSFTYDAVGNRTDHGATYLPSSNRLSAFDGCTYTTDADGNVTSRTCGGQTTNFWWSSENRLDSVGVGGVTHRVVHDAAGRLLRVGTSYFLWEGDRLLAELDGAGQVGTEYSYYPGLDNPHAAAVLTGANPGMRLAHTDALGNVRAETDTFRTVTANWQYGAWGTRATPPEGWGQIASRAAWKGALFMPELGELYYMRNRWYEPRTGRFLSEDPIGLSGGINPYAFAGNDPINGRDPKGLCHDRNRSHPEPGQIAGTCVVAERSEYNYFIAMILWSCNGMDERCVGRYLSNYDYQGQIPADEPPTPTRGPTYEGPACKRELTGAAISIAAQSLQLSIFRGAGRLATSGVFARGATYAGANRMPLMASHLGGRAGTIAATGGAQLAMGSVLTGAQAAQAFYSDAPWWYEAAKFVPFLGMGLEIGEAINVCLLN